MTPLGSNPKEGSSPVSHHLGLLSEEKFRPRAKIENRKELDQWEAKFPSWDVGSYTLRSMPKKNIANVFEAAPQSP